MNYLVDKLLSNNTGFYLEVAIAVIIGIILILLIIMLTVIKKLKDK